MITALPPTVRNQGSPAIDHPLSVFRIRITSSRIRPHTDANNHIAFAVVFRRFRAAFTIHALLATTHTWVYLEILEYRVIGVVRLVDRRIPTLGRRRQAQEAIRSSRAFRA
jgi:hypothetical protein